MINTYLLCVLLYAISLSDIDYKYMVQSLLTEIELNKT